MFHNFRTLNRTNDWADRSDNTKVLEALGEVTGGVLYKAMDLKRGQLVVLKSVPPHVVASEELGPNLINVLQWLDQEQAEKVNDGSNWNCN
jgi:hypothetical protein